MARPSSIDSRIADSTAIDLIGLLSRLEHTLLSPDANPRARTSSFDRARIGANLEYARSLLLRLEWQSPSIKVQSLQQQTQKKLIEQRDLIKRLDDRLYELNQLDDDDASSSSSEDEDGEDLLGDFEGNGTKTEDHDREQETNGQAKVHGLEALGSPTADMDSTTLRARRPLSSPTHDTGQTTGASTSSTAQTEKLMSHNRSEQETLTSSLLSMAQALKESSTRFNESLESEKEVLNRAGEGLEKNTTGMEAAGKRMGTLRRMAEGKGWWGRMMMYAWIFGLMLLALFIVAFLPKLRF
ncbi:MAG: hypothetical protein M1835_003738 [Candelina submexicana]|nr:MAG: hypothetical protein M1835_003738 [Candelina submexicana]